MASPLRSPSGFIMTAKSENLADPEELTEATPLKAPTPYFSKPATPDRRPHPPGFRNGSAKRSEKGEKCLK